MLSIQAMDRSRKPVAKTAVCRVGVINMALLPLLFGILVPGKSYSVVPQQNGS
jgi:hypothetical protein